jgi:hypothetical protein
MVNGHLELTLLGEEGRTYQLEQSSDLVSWNSVFSGELPKGKPVRSIPKQERLCVLPVKIAVAR